MLALVSLAFAALVLLVVGTDRFIGYDEALYLLEAQNLGESHFWGDHRALGIPLLIIPILHFVDASLSFLRYWFVILNALLLFLAFRLWQQLIGSAAILAAALLSVSWLGLVYGPTALPNLPTGLAALGLLGAFLLRLEQGSGWLPSILGFGVFLAIVRPTATAALLLVATGAVFHAWWRKPPPTSLRNPMDRLANPWFHLIPLVSAFLVGGLIWVVDSLRLDGPVDRFLAIVSFTGGGEGQYFEQLSKYVSRFDNYTSNGSISVLDVTLGLFLLVGITTALSAREAPFTQRRSVLAALIMSLLFFATYLMHYFVDVRLLLPAWCAMTIPVAVGYQRTIASGSAVVKWLGIGVFGMVAIWSLLTAHRIADEYDARSENSRIVAEYLREDSAGMECRFATDRDTIQIEVMSGCLGVTVIGSVQTRPDQFRLDPDDTTTLLYAVYWGQPEIETFYDSWPMREVETGTVVWRVFKEPARDSSG
ncbi:hypothetical protein BH23ACT4_BH23ACT4_05480 [soil metagenome]